MPSVISLTRVPGAIRWRKRTWYPTSCPSPVPISAATRAATLRAAIRLGWVWPIIAPTPRPVPRQIFASWVLFPDPVAPVTSVTGCAATARAIACAFSAIGRSAATSVSGTDAARAARRAADPSTAAISSAHCPGVAFRPSFSRRRRRRAASASMHASIRSSSAWGETARAGSLIAPRSSTARPFRAPRPCLAHRMTRSRSSRPVPGATHRAPAGKRCAPARSSRPGPRPLVRSVRQGRALCIA